MWGNIIWNVISRSTRKTHGSFFFLCKLHLLMICCLNSLVVISFLQFIIEFYQNILNYLNLLIILIVGSFKTWNIVEEVHVWIQGCLLTAYNRILNNFQRNDVSSCVLFVRNSNEHCNYRKSRNPPSYKLYVGFHVKYPYIKVCSWKSCRACGSCEYMQVPLMHSF